MKITQFLGINNIADKTRLKTGEMVAATDIDIGSTGNFGGRRGRELLAAGAAHSIYESAFGLLAVIDSDLVLTDFAGAVLRTVYPSIGYTRVWYATLADGRVAFSNGLINGLATATTTAEWGIDAPPTAGEGIPGDTMYQVSYTRLSDGLEGPPTYGTLIDTAQAIIGLQPVDGYMINVYFAPHGQAMFWAGSTLTDTYTHSGPVLGGQWTGIGLSRPPAGTQITPWLSRVLLAQGSTLWATRPLQPELVDLTQDFIQFPHDITLIYGTNSGVFIGTSEGITWLDGTVFGEMRSQQIATGHVALGSAVEFPLGYLNEKKRPQGLLQGAICLVGGVAHLIYGNGQIIALTAERYRTEATEVYATVRMRDGLMQYLAAPA